MSKNTSKFLLSDATLCAQYGRLGNRHKTGSISISDCHRYQVLNRYVRHRAVLTRHATWQALYNKVYQSAKTANLSAGMTEKRARKQAHLKAQSKVALKFDVTVRGVQKAIIAYEQPVNT